MKAKVLALVYLLSGCGGSSGKKSSAEEATNFKKVDTTPSTLAISLNTVAAFATAEIPGDNKLRLNGASSLSSVALDAQGKILADSSIFQNGREDIKITLPNTHVLNDGSVMIVFQGGFEVVYGPKDLIDPTVDPTATYDVTLPNGLKLREDCDFMVIMSKAGDVKCLSKGLKKQYFTGAAIQDSSGNIYMVYQDNGSEDKFNLVRVDSGDSSSKVMVKGGSGGFSVTKRGMIYTAVNEYGRITTADGKSKTLSNLAQVKVAGDKLLVQNSEGAVVAYSGSDLEPSAAFSISGDNFDFGRNSIYEKVEGNVLKTISNEGILTTYDADAGTITVAQVFPAGKAYFAVADKADGSMIYASNEGVFSTSVISGFGLTYTEEKLSDIASFDLARKDDKVIFSGTNPDDSSKFVSGTIDLQSKAIETSESEFKITNIVLL